MKRNALIFEALSSFSLCLLFMFFGTSSKGQASDGKFVIGAGAVVTVTSNANIVANCDIDNRGTITNNGTLVLNGSKGQSFPGSNGIVAAMYKLEIRNSGTGVNLNKSITINKELKLTLGNLALGNSDITIQSTADQTAAVSAIGAGAGVSYNTGRFVVERFVKIGNIGHGKGWQLLSAPANGESVKDCWMEGGANTTGYGTQTSNSSGIGGGYDQYSAASSIKTYVSATGGFDNGPVNTAALMNNPKGYFLFVRGDRTVTFGGGVTPTTLRMKGTIHTPSAPPAALTVAADKFESVGNPYPSQIDFKKLAIEGGTDSVFYTWDPNLSGTYGGGAYQTMSATNGWIPVPGGGAYVGVHSTIESGQAFFVHSTSEAGSIAFGEDAKTGASILLNREPIAGTASSKPQFMRASLITSTGLLADGNAAVFNTNLGNEVDGNDAIKIMNAGENFGLSRSAKRLAVEGRKPITGADTLVYFMSKLRVQPYRLVFVPQDMDNSNQAWLQDRFTQQQSPVSLTDSTIIDFVVTTDPLSADSNRFMLIFKALNTLPISYFEVQASRLTDHTNYVQWKISAPTQIAYCVVERSGNGLQFSAVSPQILIGTASTMIDKSYQDMSSLPSRNYYRIRAMRIDGSILYSEVAVVDPLNNQSSVSVYPNPVAGKLVQVFFSKMPAGSYEARLINTAGQELYGGKINNNQNAVEGTQFTIPSLVPAGNYQLNLTGPAGNKKSVSIIVL